MKSRFSIELTDFFNKENIQTAKDNFIKLGYEISSSEAIKVIDTDIRLKLGDEVWVSEIGDILCVEEVAFDLDDNEIQYYLGIK